MAQMGAAEEGCQARRARLHVADVTIVRRVGYNNLFGQSVYWQVARCVSQRLNGI
jgi:hypothetical protein